MNLIEEIETELRHGAPAIYVENQWPRIRAALLAAKEMDKELADAREYLEVRGPSSAQDKFREAMDGKVE